MTIAESILTALFIVVVVFSVLVALWIVLRILGAIFIKLDEMKAAAKQTPGPNQGQQG